MGVAWNSVLERRDPAGRSLPPTGKRQGCLQRHAGRQRPVVPGAAGHVEHRSRRGRDEAARYAALRRILISGFAVLVVFPVLFYLWRSLSLPGGRLFRGFDPTDLSAYEEA